MAKKNGQPIPVQMPDMIMEAQVKALVVPKPGVVVVRNGDPAPEGPHIVEGTPIRGQEQHLDLVIHVLGAYAEPSALAIDGRVHGGAVGMVELFRCDFTEWRKRCMAVASRVPNVPSFIDRKEPWEPTNETSA